MSQEDFLSRTMRFFAKDAAAAAPAKQMNIRKKKKVDVLGKLRQHEMAIYGVVLTATVIAAGTTAYFARESDSALAEKRAALALESGKLQPLTYKVDDLANKVVAGRSDLFPQLSNANGALNALPQSMMEHALDTNRQAIENISENVNKLMILVAGVQSAESGLKSIDKSMGEISDSFGDMSVLLLDLSRTLPSAERATALKIDAAMQRIGRNIANAYTAPSFTALMADIGISMEDVYSMLEELPTDDPKVMRVAEIIEGIGGHVENMIAQSALISKAKSNVSEIDELSRKINSDVEVLTGMLNDAEVSRDQKLTISLGALSVLLILLMLVRYTQISRRAASDAKRQNSENQAAILNLMDELDAFANGDLTGKATVNESITGSVADSINYTIGSLRGLVKMISEASGKIRQSTETSSATAQELASVVASQSAEILEAGKLIERVAQSIRDIDASVERSADVSKTAVVSAGKGASAVAASIDGMNNIRDHIQDTSKRIKRLGESSQEIGNIVSLIASITEQTRVLALNAALQAAQAGEAGRGFAIVAEEVQTLADRSANATTQIAARVQLIQSDTHDAIAAMERSTAGVVDGGRLISEVNEALQEIRRVSDEMAEIVESISESAHSQSVMAAEMTAEMDKLKEGVQRSGAGVSVMGQSVLDVSAMVEVLEGSIKKFKF